METGYYVDDWPHRATYDLPSCVSVRGVRIHVSKSYKLNSEKPQDFQDKLTDEAVRKQKLEEQQKQRPTIMCEEEELENVYQFTYLGSVFPANAEQVYDVKRRIVMVMIRCGRLNNIFDTKNISLSA